MRFGDALRHLLLKYGWTRSRLVKTLQQDRINPSLVYRWLRNERTPRLDSGYRDLIAAHLGLSDEDRLLLRAAQVESLEEHGHSPRAHEPELGSTPPGSWRPGFPAQRWRGPNLLLPPAIQGLAPGPIWGRSEIVRAAVSLLEYAPRACPGGHPEILLTSQSADDYELPSGDKSALLAALRESMERGYDVVHLMRLDGDLRRSMRLARLVLHLHGAPGRYYPRYFTEYGRPACIDMTVVPGAGGMIGLAGEEQRGLAAALVLRDPTHVDVLRAHLAGLRSQTEPLVKRFELEREMARFMEAIARVAEKEGETYLAGWSLSPCTWPYSWCREDSDWVRGLSHLNIDPHLAIKQQRRCLDAFYHHVSRFEHREICPKSVVLEMAQHGSGSPLDPYPWVTLEDRLQHLENVMSLLITFDKYQLALVSGSEEMHLTQDSWLVKSDVRGDHSVLMGSLPEVPRRRHAPVGGEISEPTICHAFRLHFLDLWDNKISPVSKDRRDVLRFLEAQVDRLREATGLDGNSGRLAISCLASFPPS